MEAIVNQHFDDLSTHLFKELLIHLKGNKPQFLKSQTNEYLKKAKIALLEFKYNIDCYVKDSIKPKIPQPQTFVPFNENKISNNNNPPSLFANSNHTAFNNVTPTLIPNSLGKFSISNTSLNILPKSNLGVDSKPTNVSIFPLGPPPPSSTSTFVPDLSPKPTFNSSFKIQLKPQLGLGSLFSSNDESKKPIQVKNEQTMILSNSIKPNLLLGSIQVTSAAPNPFFAAPIDPTPTKFNSIGTSIFDNNNNSIEVEQISDYQAQDQQACPHQQDTKMKYHYDLIGQYANSKLPPDVCHSTLTNIHNNYNSTNPNTANLFRMLQFLEILSKKMNIGEHYQQEYDEEHMKLGKIIYKFMSPQRMETIKQISNQINSKKTLAMPNKRKLLKYTLTVIEIVKKNRPKQQ